MRFRRNPALLLAVLALLLRVTAAFGAEPVKGVAPTVQRLSDPDGVHNLFALGTNLFSGSTPEGDAGFAALQKLGVRTILSVDGARPDVELAARYGLRYVHLPHGYDGIGIDLQAQLAKAGAVLPRPLYVHCHHGKHRGPTAAAVIGLADEGWTPEQAQAWLRLAGTSTNYAGLYQTVAGFRKPTRAELESVPAEFPSTARVSGLVDAMVSMDERWEGLKAVRAAGYMAPRNHPDLQPANEAVILWEHYREAARLPEAERHGPEFLERLRTAEREVRQIEQGLRDFARSPDPSVRMALDQAFDAAAKSCITCHQAFRDVRGR
jgi:hypothetical protein